MANIRIDDDQMRLLKEYEAKTGVRAAKCVEEAVAEWLAKVAPVRLRALDRTREQLIKDGAGFATPEEMERL